MTFADFKRNISVISKERCSSVELHPLQFGIERNLFEEEKLKRLISLAEKTKCATAERRKEAWLRQLIRVRDNRVRMEKMRDEIAASPKIEILFRNHRSRTEPLPIAD